MPQNSNCRLPRGHRFSQKMEVTVMAPNHGGEPLGSILGPMGSHWVKNVKNYHAPKFEFSITPRSSIFPKKWKLRLWRQIYVGDPLGSILGPVGSNWVQKMCQTAKKLPCPKIRIFDYPTVIGFSRKNGIDGYGAKSPWGPPRFIFGSNGVPLG